MIPALPPWRRLLRPALGPPALGLLALLLAGCGGGGDGVASPLEAQQPATEQPTTADPATDDPATAAPTFFALIKPREVSTPTQAPCSMRNPVTSQFWMISTPRLSAPRA